MNKQTFDAGLTPTTKREREGNDRGYDRRAITSVGGLWLPKVLKNMI
jgi:hypothetical protein